MMTNEIMQFFKYEHLPAAYQEVSKKFSDLANDITVTIATNTERDLALRKLLEAKDCAVRAVILNQQK